MELAFILNKCSHFPSFYCVGRIFFDLKLSLRVKQSNFKTNHKFLRSVQCFLISRILTSVWIALTFGCCGCMCYTLYGEIISFFEIAKFHTLPACCVLFDWVNCPLVQKAKRKNTKEQKASRVHSTRIYRIRNIGSKRRRVGQSV